MRGDNVFIYQNIIIHYKYLHNNIRTFVEILDQSIYAFFCPAPRIFVLVPPRPAGKSSAPHIPGLNNAMTENENDDDNQNNRHRPNRFLRLNPGHLSLLLGQPPHPQFTLRCFWKLMMIMRKLIMTKIMVAHPRASLLFSPTEQRAQRSQRW